MSNVRRRTWGVACGAVGAVLACVALVVVLSKLRVMVEDPFSFATAVLAVAVVGAVGCAREARRSLA
ncbi:MAG: hypothetical protein ACTHN0_08065 [Aquihabitans sp.]